MTVEDSIQHTIHALWDTLADFDASRAKEARNHLLAGICALIGTQNAVWIGAVRLGEPESVDPINGWRPRTIHQLHSTQQLDQLAKEQRDLLEAGTVDETTVANAAGAGRFRVNRLCDLVPESWFKSDYYRAFYLGAGHRDTIWAGVPINEDAESYFGFHRGLDQPPFGTREMEIVSFALRGLRWFHRQQMLSEGLGVASAPLTPLEQRVLRGLLQGLSEKQIAKANAQSPHTTHEYVKRILRKFGVSSRVALMALWLGQSPSP